MSDKINTKDKGDTVTTGIVADKGFDTRPNSSGTVTLLPYEHREFLPVKGTDSSADSKKHKAIYVHPSGKYVYANSVSEGLVYQKAFGGVCVAYDEGAYNKSIKPLEKMAAEKYPNIKTYRKRVRDGTMRNIILDAQGVKVYHTDGYEDITIGESFARYGSVGCLPHWYQGMNDGPNEIIATQDNEKMSRIHRSSMLQVYKELDMIPKTDLVVDDLREPLQVRNHPELFEEQEKVLKQLQEQRDGFHLLSGEVGVGKTHIAAAYINDYLEKDPTASILVIEPIDGVVENLTKLINVPVGDSWSSVSDGGVMITDDTSAIRADWDVIVFDEFHNMDKDSRVSRYPLDSESFPANVLAMTGTVSNTYPEQIWSTSKNYISRYAKMNGASEDMYQILSPVNPKGFPQMTVIRGMPEFFLEHVLDDCSVTLLRHDIKELGLEEKMPVNKYAAGIELTDEDKLFYNFMTSRAYKIGISQSEQLHILDVAFNTNQKDFVVHPSRTDGSWVVNYRLVDPNEVDKSKHDLLFLGRHDQPFVDKKIDFISNLHAEKQEKILLYLNDDAYAGRIVDDLSAKGVNAEFVDTRAKGAVSRINNSDADVVIFDVNPIKEGVDLHANHVVWYSTPESAGVDEQACGRITRLSSEKVEKNFYYLYHKTTIQQDLTNNIIRTNEVNNVALKREKTVTEELELSL